MKKVAEKKGMLGIKVRKPSFWLYILPALIVWPLVALIFRHKTDRSALKMRKLKDPVLAIASHCSTFDIVISVLALLPKRFNIVTGKDLFSWPALKPFIKRFGAIPKSQNAIDLQSMRIMKAAVEQNRNILIYPEGKTSLDGKNLFYINPSISKFIKFIDCDVVMVKTNGVYLTKPRYFHGFRRGKIQSKPYVLLTKEEVRTLSNKEIYSKVSEALKFNDHVWQRENNVKFVSSHLAQNLNYILYKCPKCGAEYEMESDEHYLTCKRCNNKVEYTPYGELKPIGDSVSLDRVDLWYDYEREEGLKEFFKEGFYMENPVNLLIEDKQQSEYTQRGEGVFFMDKENLGYKGTKDGENMEVILPLKQLSTIITKNKEGIDLVVGEEIYRFLFTEHKWSSKYGNIVEQYCAYRNGLLAKTE